MSRSVRIVTKKIPIISIPKIFAKEIYDGYWNINGKIEKVIGCYVFANVGKITATKRLGRIVLKHSNCQFEEVVYNGQLTENGVIRQKEIIFTPFQFDFKGQEIEYYYENYLATNYDLILMLKIIEQI